MAGGRCAARLGDRGAVRPQIWPPPGGVALSRDRVVPEVVLRAGRGAWTALRRRVRRGDVEFARVDQRTGARGPPLRLHRLWLRPHATPEVRRRNQRAGGTAHARGRLLEVVPRRGPLPARLAG